MRLVLRRANEAKGLLLAAGIAALVAIAMVTGMAAYNRRSLEAGKRSVVESATAAERSLLISGSVGATSGGYATRDAAVRDAIADGLGGVAVTVVGARYGSGRQLAGELGEFSRPGDALIFAEMATLDDLSAYAQLSAGAWPRPGADPLQVSLPAQVAGKLGVDVGDRVPVVDRATERRSEVAVVGLWEPRDPGDPYWRLAPGIAADTTATTIGPFVLDPADFSRVFSGSTSAAWVAVPDLRTATMVHLGEVRRDVQALVERLPKQSGLGSSGQVDTQLDRLTDRLRRADLVGRSALFTPVLLIVILGGYALILVSALLYEDRRPQLALLRARGASRRQIVGLAAREAALVVLPVAALAPVLATRILRYVEGVALTGTDVDPRPSSDTWLVALTLAIGCLLALLGPALRRAGTYIEELGVRSRPGRWAVAQRASVDVALVGLAVLAWVQLHQYSSPVAGAVSGVDPLLAAAPTLGVLGAAVIALRLLPPVTRVAERAVSRRPWTATVFGMWQAGRRPHAGPVLLLALAVGASTLAWGLVATWHRSLTDQANHLVGADLRVVEKQWFVPDGRADQLAALPGVRTVLPAWRDEIRIGDKDTPATLVALDAASAAGVVRLDDNLVESSPRELFDRMVRARPTLPGPRLPAGVRRLTGTIRTPSPGAPQARTVTTDLLLATEHGQTYRVALATSSNDGTPVRFSVELPDTGSLPVRVVGFQVHTLATQGTRRYGFELTDLRMVGADGTASPADLAGSNWKVVKGTESMPAQRSSATSVIAPYTARVEYRYFLGPPTIEFTVLPDQATGALPAVVTPEVRDMLSLQIGQTTRITVPGGSLRIRIVGVVAAVPTATDTPAALLLDLPSAAAGLRMDSGQIRPVSQWWIATDPARHAAAARAARDLPGVTVLDRVEVATRSGHDPYWRGARAALLAAAFGAALLAVVGLGVDVWATARRRLSELAVLHTLGAAPRLLARALLAEQAFLAGIGVAVGLIVGGGVGATMAPLVIMTSSADRPVPTPVFQFAWGPVGATAGALLAVALVFSGLVALTIRRRVAAAQLRIGADR